jgi:hypothetical protein
VLFWCLVAVWAAPIRDQAVERHDPEPLQPRAVAARPLKVACPHVAIMSHGVTARVRNSLRGPFRCIALLYTIRSRRAGRSSLRLHRDERRQARSAGRLGNFCDHRLKLLDVLEKMRSEWLSADMIAAIEPMCDRGYEIVREGQKLGPKALDVFADGFVTFAILNPSLIEVLRQRFDQRREAWCQHATKFKAPGVADVLLVRDRVEITHFISCAASPYGLRCHKIAQALAIRLFRCFIRGLER